MKKTNKEMRIIIKQASERNNKNVWLNGLVTGGYGWGAFFWYVDFKKNQIS